MQATNPLCRATDSVRERLRRSPLSWVVAGALVGTLASAARADEKPVAELFPAELVAFVPYDKNPVFTAAGPGHWDAKVRERGWIVREGNQYRLWYTGYDGARAGIKLLGYATSDDGVRWTRDPHNPIYKDRWIEDVMIVDHDHTYYMFAEGYRFGRAYMFGGRLLDEAQLLTSADGVRWTRQGPLEFRGQGRRPLGPGTYGTPTAWFQDGVWYLLYEQFDAGIWLAKSKDARDWTNVQDEPVMLPGPAKYDNRMIAVNQVIRHNGRYYAYYHATGDDDPGHWSTNVAASDDLLHWTKYPGNPIVKNNKSSGILVHDGRRYRLYTMHDQVDVYFPKDR